MSKSAVKRLRQLIGANIFAVALLVALVLRFRHMDLSETRLFFDFWWIWLVDSVAAIVATLLIFR